MNYLQNGDFVCSLNVIASPGHTPGHVCFFDIRDKALIAGDVYSAVVRVATSAKAYWLFPPPGRNTWDRQMAQASSEKLLLFDIKLLLCGHGKAVPNPLEKMRYAVEKSAG